MTFMPPPVEPAQPPTKLENRSSTGTAPSGSPYTLDFTEVIELRDGKIATVKVYLDPEEVERVMG
jgi:ketosteroid isomerase-like protein